VSRAALAAGVAVIALAVVGAAFALAGSSDDSAKSESGGNGRLNWVAEPHVFTPKTLPRDRVMVGDLRNGTLKEIDVRASKDVKLLDADGRSIPHTTIFIEGFGRDIYPPRYLRQVPFKDQLRLGLRAVLNPGDYTPITVAWRVPRGGKDAVTLRMPGGDVEVPSPD
jgi:hypothetical protein